MRTLVLGDIHHKWEKAEKIIQNIRHSQVVLLGDYFDNFGDGPSETAETADWLLNSLKQKNRIHILGNHDAPYFYKNPKLDCPGYDSAKQAAIPDELRDLVWEKVKLFHYDVESNTLFTHAGFSRYHCKEPDRAIPELKAASKTAINLMKHTAQNHWIYEWGFQRGGVVPCGGLLWCDYHEFSPIAGLQQVFGHTPARTPRFVNEGNLCIDCYLEYIAIIEGGKIKVLKNEG